ncbi:MAG: hypothetical protein WCK78_01990 [Paludibacter sp.]
MIRVIEIIDKTPYTLVCKFNNGIVKKIDILPIIENHKHIVGVQNLLNESVFNTVRIGEFGEIVWDKIVKSSRNGEDITWDYDISPEFAYENSILVESPFTIAS